MTAAQSNLQITPPLANPAPLGLLGFGMTTVLLNLHNAGFYPLTGMILAMGIFYGGLAQIIAGVQEWKMGNTFGATAFTSYGLFWLTLVGLLALPKMGFTPDNGTSMAAYLGMWGVFTLFMFFGTLKLSRSLQVIFGSLVVLFFLLAIEKATGNEELARVAGFEGIFCGASAIYGAVAQILNEVYGRTVLPLGAPAAK
ncbi:MAG TPA: acetate uptake transporter [Chromobacteriaceae bacterium]|nr:acetate uptake transporter [Chromobacteriaceae bacterium]